MLHTCRRPCYAVAATLHPPVPAALAGVLQDALAVRPDRRPATAAAMRETLRAARVPATSPALPLKGGDGQPAARGSGVPVEAGVSTPARDVATVLFTDIVDSTSLAEKMGDVRWGRVVDGHNALVRAQLARFHGQAINTMGDGFLAVFERPGQAIGCACAIRDAVTVLDIKICAGLHIGECRLQRGDVVGVAVNLASRVIGAAGPSEVLVSHALRDAVRGSDIGFEDRGVHQLKGFAGTFRLFSARVPDSGVAIARSNRPTAATGEAPFTRPDGQKGRTAPPWEHVRTWLSGRERWLKAAGGLLFTIAVLVWVLRTFVPMGQWGSIPSTTVSRIAAVAGPVTAPGTVLFQADWSNGLGGWTGGGSDWRAVDRMLVSEGPRERSIIIAPFRPPSPDYGVEAEIQRTANGPGFVSFAILARGDSRGGYWAGAHVGTGRSPSVGLEAELPSEPTKLLMARYFDWHRYRIDMRGQVLRVYLDGEHKLDSVDDSFRAGGETGLWAWGTQIRVRSFKIIGL